MENRKTTNLDDEKAQPLGDTGDGETGVPDSEQGISNRAGDKADDDEEFDEDLDELDEEGNTEAGSKTRA